MRHKTVSQLYCAIGVLFTCTPGSVAGDQPGGLRHIYEEPLGGVYSQGWYAQPLDSRNTNAHHLYVIGDGKSGDFFGVLSVDCETPRFSKWLATGGNLTPDRIPSVAIVGIRQLACAN